jgi:hypothetical protein
MDQKVKNYLGFIIMATLLVFAFSAFSYVSTYSKMIQPGSYRTFAVSGQGKATSKNDIAVFTYSVMIQGGKDIAVIKKQSDDLTSKIQTVLKNQGVDSKDVETVSYNLEPRYQNFACPVSNVGISVPCRPSEIIGYTLSQTDSVKIRDLAKVDAVVSGVVASGANNVSQLNFTVDDPSALQTEAKAAAIKNAIAQAQVLAKAGGFSVGRIISIDEGGVVPMAYDSYGLGGQEMKVSLERASVSNLNPGSNEVSSNVNVRFEIN